MSEKTLKRQDAAAHLRDVLCIDGRVVEVAPTPDWEHNQPARARIAQANGVPIGQVEILAPCPVHPAEYSAVDCIICEPA